MTISDSETKGIEKKEPEKKKASTKRKIFLWVGIVCIIIVIIGAILVITLLKK